MAEKLGSSLKTIKCSSCGYENILGLDGCEQCMHSLTQRQLPRPRKDDRFQRAMMTAPVSELLPGMGLLIGRASDTVEKIVKVLKRERKTCLLIYEHKKLVGILSVRDLLRKVAGKFKDLSKIKVEEVMTPNPEHVRVGDLICYAVNMMAMGGCRHVPVLDNDGTPLAIITIRDVLTYLSRQEKQEKSV